MNKLIIILIVLAGEAASASLVKNKRIFIFKH